MNIILTGVKIQQDTKTLSFRKNNLVDVINITVDTDESWEYKLDVEYPVNKTTGQKLYNVIDLVRNGNVCSVVLTADMLPFNGKYIMQLRGINSDKVYHTDTFEVWVKYSIDVGDVYNPVPSEFYQIEDNITEMNNHPPYPGDNGKWMIWDVDKHEYVESDIDVVGGGGGDYQTKNNLTTSITAESTNEQYPSAKATYDYGQSIAESAGKINAITVNDTAQIVEDKTAKMVVNKSAVGLSDVNNTSDENRPVSSAQASAIADAKQAGTTAQANLDAHIDNKENPHEVTKAQVGLGNVNNTSDANKPISTATQNALNEKLDKTAVVDVTVEALKGQAADAKSVYDAIQAAKPDIVTPTAESTSTQAASAKAVWDSLPTLKTWTAADLEATT